MTDNAKRAEDLRKFKAPFIDSAVDVGLAPDIAEQVIDVAHHAVDECGKVIERLCMQPFRDPQATLICMAAASEMLITLGESIKKTLLTRGEHDYDPAEMLRKMGLDPAVEVRKMAEELGLPSEFVESMIAKSPSLKPRESDGAMIERLLTDAKISYDGRTHAAIVIGKSKDGANCSCKSCQLEQALRDDPEVEQHALADNYTAFIMPIATAISYTSAAGATLQ